MSQTYGSKINPNRSLKKSMALKGNRKSIRLDMVPREVKPGGLLIVKFPSLASDDVIVPGSTKLEFDIELESETDENRTLYPNLARNLIKQVKIKLGGNDIFILDDADVYYNFKDAWRPRFIEKQDQGLELENVTKLRIGAGDANVNANSGKDKAIADAYSNKYCIPLDFEMLTEHYPFYPSGLNNQLTFEFKFNDSNAVVKSTDGDAKYKISGLTLNYKTLENKHLAEMIRRKIAGRTQFYYERVQRSDFINFDKSDVAWSIKISQNIRSLKGVLLLFKEDDSNPNSFYNPKIKNTTVTIEGKPSQLFDGGLNSNEHWDEIKMFFGDSSSEFGAGVAKDLGLYSMTLGKYLKDNYGLWLDMRSDEDNKSHGSGRKIGQGGGILINIKKTAETAGGLSCYVFIVMDAQLNIENGNFANVQY